MLTLQLGLPAGSPEKPSVPGGGPPYLPKEEEGEWIGGWDNQNYFLTRFKAVACRFLATNRFRERGTAGGAHRCPKSLVDLDVAGRTSRGESDMHGTAAAKSQGAPY